MIALMSMTAMANHLGMVTFPYSMVYVKRDQPAWAKDAIKHYAENLLHMVEIMAGDAKSWR